VIYWRRHQAPVVAGSLRFSQSVLWLRFRARKMFNLFSWSLFFWLVLTFASMKR
jgi:hypothetical protein